MTESERRRGGRRRGARMELSWLLSKRAVNGEKKGKMKKEGSDIYKKRKRTRATN